MTITHVSSEDGAALDDPRTRQALESWLALLRKMIPLYRQTYLFGRKADDDMVLDCVLAELLESEIIFRAEDGGIMFPVVDDAEAYLIARKDEYLRKDD